MDTMNNDVVLNNENGQGQKNSRPKGSRKIIVIAAIVAVIIAAIVIVIAAGSKGRALKKQLNLGQKYLGEMNYEEAIASFEKALELEPMSEEAYLGIADAHIAMAEDGSSPGDYDSILAFLNEAKAILEKGIEIITNAGGDASSLSEKLDEVISEIEQIKEEAEAKRKAEEEEAAKKAEEERLASLKYVELQPILDAVSNVWGREWDEWTADEFRRTFNIKTFYYGNGRMHEADKESRQNYIVEETEDGVFFAEYDWNGSNDGIVGAGCTQIYISNSKPLNYGFDQYIAPYCDCYVEGNLYDFAGENGITSADSFISYCGITGLNNDGDEVSILTDFGEATIKLIITDSGRYVYITLNDSETNPVIGEVYVSENVNDEGELRLSMGLSKHMDL